jgi:hypothetical protein
MDGFVTADASMRTQNLFGFRVDSDFHEAL